MMLNKSILIVRSIYFYTHSPHIEQYDAFEKIVKNNILKKE